MSFSEIPDQLKMTQFWTFNHLSVFFIGLSLGYRLNRQQTKYSMGMVESRDIYAFPSLFIQFVFVSKLRRLVFWSVLPLISVAAVVIAFLWNDLESQPSLELSIVYNGLNRVVFIAGIYWLVSQCLHSKAG